MSDVATRLSTALADRYRVERELGAGGMATVYLAHDLKHDRDVAIKVLHPDLGAALGERAVPLARSARRRGCSIRTSCRCSTRGEADGLLYYVMPLVTGETLRDRLEREHQLADRRGRAHRARGRRARSTTRTGTASSIATSSRRTSCCTTARRIVADFGIALAVQPAGGTRMTQTGLSLGTPQYMSPEQAMGERTIDARSDVYALGAVLYEMLAGEPPFTGSERAGDRGQGADRAADAAAHAARHRAGAPRGGGVHRAGQTAGGSVCLCRRVLDRADEHPLRPRSCRASSPRRGKRPWRDARTWIALASIAAFALLAAFSFARPVASSAVSRQKILLWRAVSVPARARCTPDRDASGHRSGRLQHRVHRFSRDGIGAEAKAARCQ